MSVIGNAQRRIPRVVKLCLKTLNNYLKMVDIGNAQRRIPLVVARSPRNFFPKGKIKENEWIGNHNAVINTGNQGHKK